MILTSVALVLVLHIGLTIVNSVVLALTIHVQMHSFGTGDTLVSVHIVDSTHSRVLLTFGIGVQVVGIFTFDTSVGVFISFETIVETVRVTRSRVVHVEAFSTR
jgi:hypothetical protein